jgi:hypothetical protein
MKLMRLSTPVMRGAVAGLAAGVALAGLMPISAALATPPSLPAE